MVFSVAFSGDFYPYFRHYLTLISTFILFFFIWSTTSGTISPSIFCWRLILAVWILPVWKCSTELACTSSLRSWFGLQEFVSLFFILQNLLFHMILFDRTYIVRNDDNSRCCEQIFLPWTVSNRGILQREMMTTERIYECPPARCSPGFIAGDFGGWSVRGYMVSCFWSLFFQNRWIWHSCRPTNEHVWIDFPKNKQWV